jgi:Zn-finger nucleic acid-binding protein
MNCPVDGAELRMMDRQGIEVDYCPTCRGVWLDRGELDKLIERSAPVPARAAPDDDRAYRDRERDRYEDRDRDDERPYSHDRSAPPYRKKKRGGFLSEIFDID